ncbi:MAG TPA: zf-TFIIB domain-containing protein [Nannocystis sp.]
MRRRRPTEESRARAARISQALADLLPDEPLVAERPAERRREEGLGACPGCGAVLQRSAARHGIEIDACAECGGIWLDAGELELLTVGLDPAPGEGAVDERELRKQVPAARSHEGEVRYRECPRCSDIMTRRNFGTISGVIVDECPKHGIWLDAGELEAIEAFIRAGGRALGAAARARAAQRLLPPPPPEPLPEAEARRVRRGTALVDVLWSLFFG